MVVRDVPQRHRDGRRRRAQPAVRHGSPRMGARDGGAAGVVGDHAVHAAAADRAARVRARRAVRPAPRPRRARAGPTPGALGRRAAAAHRAARLRHGVHGHGRQVPAEVRRVRVPALRAAAPVLLDLHLRLLPVPAVPAAQPRRHHRRVLRRRRHVTLLLDHLVGRVRGARAGARGELRVQGRHRGGLNVPGVQRAGAGGVRVRGARRGAGDPGHHPVHAHQAVQGAHVEGHRRRVPRHRRLLLPRRARRILGLRARRRRQRPRRAAAAALARRRGQHDGRHPCRRKLSGVCDANIRKHRDDSGHKIQAAARITPPSRGPIGLRRIHTVHRGDFPVLRRPPRLLRRVWVHADVLLPPLHSVAEDQEAAEVQRVVVCQLGLHRRRSAVDACVYHRRLTEHRQRRVDVPVLLLNPDASMYVRDIVPTDRHPRARTSTFSYRFGGCGCSLPKCRGRCNKLYSLRRCVLRIFYTSTQLASSCLFASATARRLMYFVLSTLTRSMRVFCHSMAWPKNV